MHLKDVAHHAEPYHTWQSSIASAGWMLDGMSEHSKVSWSSGDCCVCIAVCVAQRVLCADMSPQRSRILVPETLYQAV